MVFWLTYPVSNLIQSIFNTHKFKSQVFQKDTIESPTGIEALIIKKNINIKYLTSIRQFLRLNFGSPPDTPILDIPEDKLINDKNHILIVIDNDKKIVACIRYHYLGIFTSSLNEEIFCVDCFCVNKQWRRKGVGDYLLTYLHTYVNNNNIPHSLFLKEGRKLNIIHRPLYSGVYVYRKLNSHIESNYVKSLTVKQAYKLIDMFLELNSNLFVVRNIHTSNQYWKLYKRDTYKVLVCFQDTYQSFQTDKLNHIAWVTAWIESPNMTDKYREEASKELSDMMYPEFDYVWFNKKWTGNDTRWVVDGSFYWYSYQWTTNITINQSYCILC